MDETHIQTSPKIIATEIFNSCTNPKNENCIKTGCDNKQLSIINYCPPGYRELPSTAMDNGSSDLDNKGLALNTQLSIYNCHPPGYKEVLSPAMDYDYREISTIAMDCDYREAPSTAMNRHELSLFMIWTMTG
jgi:hypothetical protein